MAFSCRDQHSWGPNFSGTKFLGDQISVIALENNHCKIVNFLRSMNLDFCSDFIKCAVGRSENLLLFVLITSFEGTGFATISIWKNLHPRLRHPALLYSFILKIVLNHFVAKHGQKLQLNNLFQKKPL